MEEVISVKASKVESGAPELELTCDEIKKLEISSGKSEIDSSGDPTASNSLVENGVASQGTSVDEPSGLEKVESEILEMLDSGSIPNAEASTHNDVETKTELSWGDTPPVISSKEVYVLEKIGDDYIEILNKSYSSITSEEKRKIEKDINDKIKRSEIIGVEFCSERKIPFPSKKNFRKIVNDLYMSQNFDQCHFEAALEEAAKNKIINDTLSSTPIISDEVKSKFRDFGKKYCESQNIAMPSVKVFNKMLVNLAKKQELDVESFKVALDEHGALEQKKRSSSKNQVVLYNQLKKLQEEMMPIATKHCHEIKSPFPQPYMYRKICKHLFDAGKLDEENLKIAIEKHFDELDKKDVPLSEDELSLILKHYCIDNDIKDVSLDRVKEEVLPKVPETLLNRKHYWALMYKERKTNLFRGKTTTSNKTAKKGNVVDSANSSTAQKNSSTSGDKKIVSNSNASKSQVTEGKSGQQKKFSPETKSSKTKNQPWTWCNDRKNVSGNTHDKSNNSKAGSDGHHSNPTGGDNRKFRNGPSRHFNGASNTFSGGALNDKRIPFSGRLDESNQMVQRYNERLDENTRLLRELQRHVQYFIHTGSWPRDIPPHLHVGEFQNQSSWGQNQPLYRKNQGQPVNMAKLQPNMEAKRLHPGTNYGDSDRRHPHPNFPPGPMYPQARHYLPNVNSSQHPTVSNNNTGRAPSKESSARGVFCRVAIVHEEYPRRTVNEKEVNLIRNALLERIGSKGHAGPRFCGTYAEKGAVVFECEDEATADWVWSNASTIAPWKNAKLRPNAWENPSVLINFEVPKLLRNLATSAICKKVASQNPGLSTEQWKLKSETFFSDSRQLVFSIDNKSLELLKSLDMRPHLGFSRIDVFVKRG